MLSYSLSTYCPGASDKVRLLSLITAVLNRKERKTDNFIKMDYYQHKMMNVP